jgi:uncharacterized membrane protein (DUF373 family)
MINPATVFFALCGIAIVMVALAGIYYHVNRDELGD